MKNILTVGFLCCFALFSACTKNCNLDDCAVVKEKYVHKYGIEICESDWETRGKSGQVVSTLDNGVVVTKYYDKGVLNGDCFYTYPHSNKIEKTETYCHGELSKVVRNDERGLPDFETHFDSDGSERVVSWYDSGNPRSKEIIRNHLLESGEYFSPQNQVESKIENGSGIKTCRDSKGGLIANEEYRDGCIISRTEYHPNGAISALFVYDENKPYICEKKTFYPEGDPKTIEQLVNGKQQGVTLVYKDGEKYAEVPYKNGLKEGCENRYRDENILVEKIHWVRDKLQGPYCTYIDGEISKTTWYFQGDPISKPEYDFKIAQSGQRK